MKKAIKITSGRGPKECSWVVGKLAQKIEKMLIENKVKFELVDSYEKDGLFESVTYFMEETNVLDSWIGPILWIGKSPFRSNHKRKNWFVEIQLFELSKEVKIDSREIEFQTMRSSGAGGQHVNKTESAVRAVHKSTGIQAVSRESRSQLENRKNAILLLEMKISEMNQTTKLNKEKEMWKMGVEIPRGNPVKTFQGEKFKLIKC